MRTGIVIQARTSSSRLPGKVLKELPYGSGVTVLEQVLRRMKRVKYADAVVVATTVEKVDDPIEKISYTENVKCFRGSRNDVLERFYLAAIKNRLDVVVRITSDCPCIDPEIVERLIAKRRTTTADYASNSILETFPRGFDAEVFTFASLAQAFREATTVHDREHVTPFIYNNKKKFRLASLLAPSQLQLPALRVTLDTDEDYSLLCAIYDSLYRKNKYFGCRDVVGLFQSKPWLKLINGKILQKRVFKSREDELKAAIKLLEMQDMWYAKGILAGARKC